MQRCDEKDNYDWHDRWDDLLEKIEKDHLPSGSGIDSGCKILRYYDLTVADFDKKIIIKSSYHHMNDNDYYDGWVGFKVNITPSLLFGATINLVGNFSDVGRDSHGTKDYLEELFNEALTNKVELSVS